MVDDDNNNGHKRRREMNWLERALEPQENVLVRKMMSEWTLYKQTLLLLWRIMYWSAAVIAGIYMARDALGKIAKVIFQ